jgi:uncharacterized membrane protein YbhN (UPF0104 family)/tRNA A-37 threonylcarbamoyl transferase component Bud32
MTADSGTKANGNVSSFRVFSSHSSEARARRPTDLVLAAMCAVGLIGATLASADGAVPATTPAWTDGLPGLFDWLWALSFDALIAWAILTLGLAVFAHRRSELLRDQALALVTATALTGLVSSIDLGQWQEVLAGVDGAPPATYPAIRLALAAAVIATASPHLTRSLRIAGRWIVGLGAVSSVLLGTALPMGAFAGLCIGFGSAAVIHLVFGSPGGRPTFDQISAALREFGIEASTIHESAFAARGVVVVRATTAEGRPLLVKVHGRDAWDGQLVAVVFTRIWYRGDDQDTSLNLRALVEHEAFLTMLAERKQVPVRSVVAAGVSLGGDAILAVDASGSSLADLPEHDITDAALDAAWSSIGRMHDAGIAHGRLSATCLALLDDGTVTISDFAAASENVTAEQMQIDDAQALIAMAGCAGADRAAASAIRMLGADRVAGLLPLLQPAVIPAGDRRAASEAKEFSEDLRATVATTLGVHVPRLAPLRRFTALWVVKVAALLFLGYVLMTSLTGMDLASVSTAIAQASQGWIWAALAVGIVATVGQAFSTMGASVAPLGLPSSFALQLAIQFTALFIPSSAARVGLCVRFFQRMGQSITSATAIGVVDSLAGFGVQVFLIVTILLSGLASLTLHLQVDGSTDPSTESSPWVVLGLLAVVLAVVCIAAASRLRKARSFVHERREELVGVARNLRSVRKDLELVGGNLVGQLLLAVALGMSLRAFGYHAALADLILVNTCVSLFSGLMPVPGGIGVTEAALTTGLIAIGIPDEVAVSTAIVYRLVTFYLPPAWGWFGLRWLRDSDRI